MRLLWELKQNEIKLGGGGQDTMISEAKSKTITILIQSHLYANYVLGLQTLTGPSGAQKISN